MNNTKNNSKNSISKKQFVIGLVAILIVGIVGAGIFQASAATEPGLGVSVGLSDGSYNATATDVEVERWKYTIRDDDTCNGSIFTNGGRDAGNLIDVVYNSNSYTPADKEEVAEFNDKYICFNALLSDGSWEQVGRQFSWTTRGGELSDIDDGTADCEDDEVAVDGECIVADNSGDTADCEDDEVAVDGECIVADNSGDTADCEDDEVAIGSECVLDDSGDTTDCDADEVAVEGECVVGDDVDQSEPGGNYIFFDGEIYEFDDDDIFTASDDSRWTICEIGTICKPLGADAGLD